MRSSATEFDGSGFEGEALQSGGFRTCAPTYLARGYVPVPLLNGKGQTPKGATGYAGVDVDERLVTTWGRDYPEAGLCIRLDGMIGIDVDHYGGKNGGDHLRVLESRIGVLPASIRISSRFGEQYDGESGIRLYRIPQDYLHFEFKRVWKSGPCPGVDLVRRAHRNANAHPTVHKRGTQYGYMDESSGVITYGVLPPAETLPEAPRPWIEHLLKNDKVTGRAKDLRSRVRRSVDPSELEWVSADEVPCARMKALLDDAVSALRRPITGGRHDYALASILRLARAGEGGHVGVGAALKALEGAFSLATCADGSRDDWERETEWQRMVDGAFALVADDPTPRLAKRCCREERWDLGWHDVELRINDIAIMVDDVDLSIGEVF